MARVTTNQTATGREIGNSLRVLGFARPADTTAYTAGDVISDDADNAKALYLGTGSGIIRWAQIHMSAAETESPELWLFRDEPTNHQDNDALALTAADMQIFIGRIDFPVGSIYTSMTSGHRVWQPTNTNLATCHAAFNGQLWGLLVARTGHTPDSATQITIHLGVQA